MDDNKEKKLLSSRKEKKNASNGNNKIERSNKNKTSLDKTLRFMPKESSFPRLSQLRDTKEADLESLLKAKISACCILFNFQTNANHEGKELKRHTLIEISEYLNLLTDPIPEFLYSDIPEMFGSNVFRVLAPFNPILPVGIEDEEDFQLLDSWPHVKIVYEIMLQLMEKSTWDVKKSKRNIDHVFVKHLLELFDSPDPRERDYIKTILHRIYGKIIYIRSFIRKHINNIFFTFIYETEMHNGIAELLEILGSIINGFQTPIKDEHKIFLTKVLLPLHKMKSLNQYHPQLAYCITEFIKKDKYLIKCIILEGLLKFWPKMQSFKELMFLSELEECLELCDNRQFETIMRPLLLQLSRCVSSNNFQVCERTLYFWTNTFIVELMTPVVKEMLPLIFPSLYTSKQHWNKQIHSMVFNALKVTMDMDPVIFDEYINQFKDNKNREEEHVMKQIESWNKMQIVAKKNPLHKKYLEAMSLSSIASINSKLEEPKSFKNIGAEIERNMSDTESIVRKLTITKSQSTVSAKTTSVNTNPKETYTFRN